MSENKTPQSTSPSTTQQNAFKFDEKSFMDKVTRLTQLKSDYSGKPNYNPFLWFNTVVQPLVDRYQKGERTKELFDSMIAIKEVVPSLGPDNK